MTITVSIGDFRKNISKYIDEVSRGATIILRDEKKNSTVAQITRRVDFDKEAYERALRRAAGTFTAKNHPEWATLAKVEKWLRKTRLNANRHFDI